jgi:glycosyltransferase involved in cell wall biosynthesis
MIGARTRPASRVGGVVARLRPEKGVDVFLAAASIVAKRLPNTDFVVVGDGPQRGALCRLATDLLGHERIRFLGARPDGPRLLAGFDVLVVPSRHEGTPLVVLEAFASGVPIVATRTGGIPEQIRDGVDGLLVAPGDAESLADAVIDVLVHRKEAQRRAQTAAREVTDRFSPSRMVNDVEEVYRLVLARKRQPLA